MDQQRLESVRQAVIRRPARRDVLRALASAGLGLGLMPALRPDASNAGKKRRRKVRRNAFGCVNVGGFCQNANQCCSDICEGKPGKKKCRAHDAQDCPSGVRDNSSCAVPAVPAIACTTSTGAQGECSVTTGNAGYCLYSSSCFPCSKDAECRAFCGPLAACTRCDNCEEDGGTSCAHPQTGGCTFP